MVVAIPDTADELRSFMEDPAKLAEIGKTPGDTLAFAQNYAKAFNKKNADFASEIAVETQKAMATLMKDAAKEGFAPVNLGGDKTIDPALARKRSSYKIVNNGIPTMVKTQRNPLALATAGDAIFADNVEFFQAIWNKVATLPNGEDLMAKTTTMQKIRNAFGSQVPADGGFLIPEILRSELLQVALASAVVRPRARVIPMDSLRVPYPMIDSTTNAGSVFGGMVAYWTEEAAALTASQASFGRITLEAKKLTVYAEAPNELIADAPAFASFLDEGLPATIAWFEDIAFHTGTGVGEPLGWNTAQNASRVLYDIAVSSQVAWTDLVGMYARMLPSSLSNAVWLCSPDVFPQLANMTFGTGSFPALFPVGGGTDAPFMTLLGRPLIVDEKMSALGSDGNLAFVDLSYYLIGDRQMMQAASSSEYKFGNDVTAYRVIERVDGRPWLQSAITPQNGSAALSPFVVAQGLHT